MDLENIKNKIKDIVNEKDNNNWLHFRKHIEDLEKLGQDFSFDINYFYSRFSGIKNIDNLNFRKIRDEILKELDKLQEKKFRYVLKKMQETHQ